MKLGSHIAAIILVLGSALGAVAQDSYKATKSKVLMTGTSTLHNWEMTAEGITGTATFTAKEGKVLDASNVTITVPVATLKSGKGAMDKNAYSALKSDKHKNITYVLTSAKVTGNKLVCSGNLTIAGVTKPFDVETVCTVNADHTITCKVVRTFNMTDFKVEPPSFMFGSVTTGDAITINFDLTFTKI